MKEKSLGWALVPPSVPKHHDLCLLKKRQRETARDNTMWGQRQRDSQATPRADNHPQSREEARRGSSLEPSEEHRPADTLIWDF